MALLFSVRCSQSKAEKVSLFVKVFKSLRLLMIADRMVGVEDGFWTVVMGVFFYRFTLDANVAPLRSHFYVYN